MAFSPVLDTGDGIQAIVECNEYSRTSSSTEWNEGGDPGGGAGTFYI